jgi:hypothetical protein
MKSRRFFSGKVAGKQLTFNPLPDPELQPGDELSTSLQTAFRRVRNADEAYKQALAELGPNASDRQRNKVDRDLKNRVRTQLGLSPFEPTWDSKKRAGELGDLSRYLQAVSDAVASRRDWKIHRYVTVGLFTFSTLAMYNDLDPDRWPAPNALANREILRP